MKLLNYLSSVKWPWLESHLFIGLQRKIVIISTICLSILLSGKFRCFGVISATFQNRTCFQFGHSCSDSLLNFIGVLGVAVSMAGSPFVTGFFLLTKSPALGGRICVHFSILIILGCISTNFVNQPDTLIITDSIIQGIGISVMMGVLAIRITELFPREHRYHVMASAFTDAGPWGTVLICPLFGVITQVTRWQQTYLFFAVILTFLILICTMVEYKTESRTFMFVYQNSEMENEMTNTNSKSIKKDEKQGSTSSQCPDHPNQSCESYKEVNEIEFWESDTNSVYSVSSDERSEYGHESHLNLAAPYHALPSFLDIFINKDNKSVMSEMTTILWLLERALHSMVLYGIVLNLVDYMVVEIQESLEKAALVMMSFGGGEVIGFIVATGLGDQLRHHLIHIYAISTGLLTVILAGWHVTQAVHMTKFSNGDAHFLALISGIVMSFCSSYTYALAEDVINRPGIIAYPLTRFCQAIGLMFVPLTSGFVISYNNGNFHNFFLVQTIFTGVRFILLCCIIWRLRKKKVLHPAPPMPTVIPVLPEDEKKIQVPAETGVAPAPIIDTIPEIDNSERDVI